MTLLFYFRPYRASIARTETSDTASFSTEDHHSLSGNVRIGTRSLNLSGRQLTSRFFPLLGELIFEAGHTKQFLIGGISQAVSPTGAVLLFVFPVRHGPELAGNCGKHFIPCGYGPTAAVGASFQAIRIFQDFPLAFDLGGIIKPAASFRTGQVGPAMAQWRIGASLPDNF
jgi:hypothetical protein